MNFDKIQLLIRYFAFTAACDEMRMQCVKYIALDNRLDSDRGNGLHNGCTNPVFQVAVTTKFSTVAPSICAFSVCNPSYVTLMAPTILKWPQIF